ncbi:MAG: hypothetical protein AB1461_07825 [Thermodesulfobacteriota bacterium]
MIKKILCTLAMPAALAFVYAVPARADVPPPPVNQNIGIPDGVFNNLVEANCRACHEDANVVNPGSIPDRHHLLVGEPIPDPTVAPGITGDNYECLSCHELAWDATTFSYSFVAFRDCLECHQQLAGQASVHHMTAKALADDCKACHGPIDNPDDGHYIPVYDTSLVTPVTGLGTGPNGEGGCAFCHDAGTDTASGVAVYTNADTHHSTGLGLAGKCILCHQSFAPGNPETPIIRDCEVCHGVNSLHNIQVDSDANGSIEPGMESAYYGHIGNQDDCWGCHGFTAAAAPLSGPVIPDITGLSVKTITAGFDTQLTISGAAFTNLVQGPTSPIELTSSVLLIAADGTETTLTPDSITENTMLVTIPASLAAGNYDLAAVKYGKVSNKVNLAVLPAVNIAAATCSNGVVSITGSGFSQYVNATGSGTSVSLPYAGTDCTVLSWNDTRILAQCSSCERTIDVDSVFGETKGAVSVKKTIVKKPSSIR